MRLLPFVVAEHYELVYLLAERSPQERDDLRTGASGFRRKGRIACPVGYALGDGPVDSAGRGVGKAGFGGAGASGVLPHKFNGHFTGARRIRGEGVPVGHAVLGGPGGCFCIIHVGFYIAEG